MGGAAPPNLEYGAFRRFPLRSEAPPGAQARAPARHDGRPTSDEAFLPYYCSCVHIFRQLWSGGLDGQVIKLVPRWDILFVH